MKIQSTICLFIFTILFSIACVAFDRDVRVLGEFHAVHVGGGIDVFIYQSDDYRVEIESDSDPDDIVTEVNGGKLTIRYKDGWSFFRWRRNDEVYVYVEDIEEIICSGGSDVEGRTRITGDYLKMEASGGSDLVLDVDVRELMIVSSGGSDVRLQGTTKFLKAESSGGSDIEAYDLVAEEANLHGSGGSDIEITIEKRIKAKASGGSDIYYRGDPTYVDIDSSSGSDIHKK